MALWKNDTKELADLRDEIRTRVNVGWATYHFLIEQGHEDGSPMTAWVKEMIEALQTRGAALDAFRRGDTDIDPRAR